MTDLSAIRAQIDSARTELNRLKVNNLTLATKVDQQRLIISDQHNQITQLQSELVQLRSAPPGVRQ